MTEPQQNTFTFTKCGCQCPVQYDDNGNMQPLFIPDITQIPLDCTRTWDLLGQGNTQGVFQLESRLGSSLAKKLKPRSIEHLAALVSIMRPGCLNAMRKDEGENAKMKSVAQHYIDRKNGVETVTYFHPALQNALEPTYGEMVYQEQAMQIARDIAGFDLQQADILRKAIGKKKPEIMAKVKKDFLQGCQTAQIVNQEQAEAIFSWIEKSQRYSFNKSHAVAYAVNAYLAAYVKAHFPRAFFTSYLYYAHNKPKPREEIYRLVTNAKNMGIDVLPYDIRHNNDHFSVINKNIYFGLIDIKNIGGTAMKTIHKQLELAQQTLHKPIPEWQWLDFLLFCSTNIPSQSVISLICTGALDYFKYDRLRMYYEFEQLRLLTKKELQWLQNRYISDATTTPIYIDLKPLLKILVDSPTGRKGCANPKRQQKVTAIYEALMNPPYSLKDSKIWIAGVEKQLLGVSLTCTEVDECNKDMANCTCQQFQAGYKVPGPYLIAVNITEVIPWKIKSGKSKGREMAFLRVADTTGGLDSVVIFTDKWSQYKNLLVTNNTVIISGSRNKNKNDADGFLIDTAWQI